jgi:hypothetical protein
MMNTRPPYGDTKTLHVIAVISNQVQYESRYRLFKQFRQEMLEAGVNLIVVETAFGERPFEVTTWANPNHLQLRTYDELWIKERMVNLALAKLPLDAEYVAWIDADISFVSKTWVQDTIDQLQHHMFVQLFVNAIDLGPDNQVIQHHTGFAYQFRQGRPRGAGYTFWHPGFAWAARREALDATGGLIDKAILGAGDHHMALAMIHQVMDSIPGDMSPAYLRHLRLWEDRCKKYIKKDLGFVDGTVLHHYHGKKKDRKYVERWSILRDFAYNPDTDIKPDSQGLWQLVVEDDRQIGLCDGLRAYFRQRNEDSTDLE